MIHDQKPCSSSRPTGLPEVSLRFFRPAIVLSSLLPGLLLLFGMYRADAAGMAKLTLVHDGVSDFSIVTAPDAVLSQKAAAEELQLYLRRISGVTLPIISTLPATGHAIIVGGGEWARQRGVDVAGFGQEELAIVSHGGDLVLAGNDSPGDPWPMHWRYQADTPTLYAVYLLLDRYLGVRWYWPGDLGEEVPQRSSITLPAPLNLRTRPAFDARFLPVSDDLTTHNDPQLWFRRNGLGSSLKIGNWHSWYQVIPESQYLADHPDYFALVHGIRGTRSGPEGHQHQLCTTNPAVQRLFAEKVIEFFDLNPDAKSFPLSANDGGGFCECDRCRALDVEKDARGNPLLTVRLFAFFNAVARQVAEKHPDRYLTVYAYDENARASHGLRLEPNLLVYDVYNFASTLWWEPDFRRYLYANMALWRAQDPGALFLSYFYLNAFNLWNLPQVSSTALTGILRHLHSLKARGISFSLAPPFAAYGQDAWLIARLAWNPEANVKALMKDYYTGLFGRDAGPLVHRYHQLIETGQRALALKARAQTPYTSLETALELYRPFGEQATRLLDQAAARVHTDRQRRRLELVRANWDYTRLSLESLTALRAIEADQRLHPERTPRTLVEKAGLALTARQALLRTLQKEDPGHFSVDADAILKMDHEQCGFFVPGRIQTLLNGGLAEARAYPFKSATSPDDRPAPDDWQTTPAFSPFVEHCTAEKMAVQTEVRALYNQRALFLRIEALEPDPRLLEADQIRDRDGPVWTENELEVFLHPDRSGRSYFHLIANSLGTPFDAKKNDPADTTWNGNWQIEVTKSEGRWTALFEVPFETLGSSPPVAGDEWRMNVCRIRRSGDAEYSAWSPTFGGFQSPQYFGRLRFVAPKPQNTREN